MPDASVSAMTSSSNNIHIYKGQDGSIYHYFNVRWLCMNKEITTQ